MVKKFEIRRIFFLYIVWPPIEGTSHLNRIFHWLSYEMGSEILLRGIC